MRGVELTNPFGNVMLPDIVPPAKGRNGPDPFIAAFLILIGYTVPSSDVNAWPVVAAITHIVPAYTVEPSSAA